MTRLVLPIALIACLLASGPVSAAPASLLAATYTVPAPPTAMVQGVSSQVNVLVQNSGDELWGSAGANAVNLSYHWYDAAGVPVGWEGARTALGAAVPPAQARTLNAAVTAPNAPGPYTLRLALVKEGVAWFPPSGPQPVNALAAYVATVTAPTLPAMIAGGSYTVTVNIRNAGAAAWNATGPNLIDVSYHWHDAQGNTVVWDGSRNPLPANVDQTATVPVPMRIDAPATPGTYTLTIDLVREGVAWFAQLGSTPFKVPVNVAAIRYAATFTPAAAVSAYWAEAKTLAVAVTNTGNVPWLTTGDNPVNLAHHIFDASGNAVVWDGKRTGLGANIAPGASATLNLAYVSPAASGTYTLAIDLVREGIGWFADTGSAVVRRAVVITNQLSGGYRATTTPGQVTIAAVIELSVTPVNYRPRPSPAGCGEPGH